MKTILLLSLPSLWRGIDRNKALGPGDLTKLFTNAVSIALVLAGTVALLFIIISGIRYMYAAGNSDRLMAAKNSLLFAIIGLLLIIASYAIINFIVARII